MICPQCGIEYQDGFSVCSDCQVALVENEEDLLQKYSHTFCKRSGVLSY